ncbi:MAG: ABC transporter substrate-binding protein [Thermoplasmata archaeon]
MNWKKIISLLIVAVFVLGSFAAITGQARAQDEYVQEIVLEVRTSQSVGIGDTAIGELDMFIQTVPGSTYEGISDDWKENLGTARSVGSYNNLYFNPYFDRDLDEPVAEVGGTYEFNPFGETQIRRAVQWLIDRQLIIEDMYGGYGMARYTPIGPNDPGYNQYIRPEVEDMGLTLTGDQQKASDMIQEAMEYWEENLETGALRKEGDYWQYQPPGGDWEDVEIEGLIRTEDERRLIGDYFSDLLEDEGIKVHKNYWDRRQAIAVAFYSNPADMQFHFYTGGWLASTAAKYQYWSMPQMYSPFYAYMPGSQIGGLWQYEEESLEMGELIDRPAQLDEKGTQLSTMDVANEEEYWELNAEVAEIGMMESVRVFIMDSLDFYPYNIDKVGAFATDAVTGYSDVFTIRTMMTSDGTFTGGQYSSEGALYMDNWNRIGGSSDVYGQQQKRLTHDYSVFYHPSKGEPIDFRAETDVLTDGAGDMVGEHDVPSDAVLYNPATNEWEEVGDGVTSATAATYDWNFNETTQKWHSGHEMSNRDIAHWLGFIWRACYETADEPDFYISEMASVTRPWLENVKGIQWNGAEDEFTIYGDYSFPIESMIANYYSISPMEPWQVIESAQQCVLDSDYAVTSEGSYDWSSGQADNWIHWLSTSQSNDFVDTLEEMVNGDFVPYQLLADRGLPFGYESADDYSDEVDAIGSFVSDYGHINIGNGPFMITEEDPDDMVMKLDRFNVDDGYPFPDDYWEDKLLVRRLEMVSIDSQRLVDKGDTISASAGGRILETYPESIRRIPQAGDNAEVGWILEDRDGNLADEGDAELSGGEFVFEISTDDLEAGSYTIIVSGAIPGQVVESSWDRAVFIQEEGGVEPEPGITVTDLNVEPSSGKEPLDVVITATVTNEDEETRSVSILIDGSVETTMDIGANESEDIEYEHTFEDSGDYTVQIGDQTTTVSVEAEKADDDTPGFTFALLGVAAVAAVLIYRKKRD